MKRFTCSPNQNIQTYVLIWFLGVVVFPEIEVGDEVSPHGGPGDSDQEGDDVIDGLTSDVTAPAARLPGAHLRFMSLQHFLGQIYREINESGTRQEKL